MKIWHDGKLHLRRILSPLILGIVSLSLLPHSSADNGPSAIPEGSGSIIQPASWQLTGENAEETEKQVRAVIQKFEGAILVKDEKDLLVLSLPSAKLTALHQELSTLGTITSPESSNEHKAPTTLLRLTIKSETE